MKYLLVLAVVGVALWLWLGGRRRDVQERSGGPARPPGTGSRGAAPPAAMLACAHCGVHLPADDALRDAEARAYCSEAHRAAGPR